MSLEDTVEQISADIAAQIREAIGPKLLRTPETREAISKVIEGMLARIDYKPFDYRVECSADLKTQTLHVSFRAPAAFLSPEQIEELKACGAFIEEVTP